ncbi:hypothetical protein E2562_033947 [Oryza meyeriana var. granulata]|uniref:Trehalose 6-phosphate phosphatase n=1 Tax=Oryza meyeriana var. granulata TaxID=110450 RepID=A0A6G1C0U0_9ORYZ|nr:hypothetical protein E2562_033947 [Oryza meyeriana var. granulata]
MDSGCDGSSDEALLTILGHAQDKKIVLFLDYDGTLSPIVNDPEKAFMSPEMRVTVQKVAKHFSTAIVSGRSRDRVFHFVKLTEIYYAGSHGMDILASTADSNSTTKKVLRERKNGCGILVSQVPKKTEAFFMLRDPSEVTMLPLMLF